MNLMIGDPELPAQQPDPISLTGIQETSNVLRYQPEFTIVCMERPAKHFWRK
jgi:hypothetical protein